MPMSPSTEIGLLAPPICSVIALALIWNIERASSGRVNPSRRKGYISACVVMIFVGYALVWQKEILFVWAANPVWMSLGILGVAAAVLYFVVTRHSEEPSSVFCIAWDSISARRQSVARRILAWVVIIWGVAGLVGGFSAVIRSVLSH